MVADRLPHRARAATYTSSERTAAARAADRGASDVSPYQWSRDGDDDPRDCRAARPARRRRPRRGQRRRGAARRRDRQRRRPRTCRCRPTTATSPTTRRSAPARSSATSSFSTRTPGTRWPLEPSPGGDVGAVLDTRWPRPGVRERSQSQSLRSGSRPSIRAGCSGEPQLLKDGVGRVRSARLHRRRARCTTISAAGFAEVYLASVDGAAPPRPEPLSPRRAVSNFYPHWSPDGRFVAYAAERSDLNATRRHARAVGLRHRHAHRGGACRSTDPIGRPFGWSPDSREVLVGRVITRRLHVVDRDTGRSR